jgi:hypothetical protein
VVAAQSGQGLKEAAALLDKAQSLPPQTQSQQQAGRKPVTSKEHQDKVRRGSPTSYSLESSSLGPWVKRHVVWQVDQEEEEYLAVLEDKLCSPRTVQNRRLLRYLHLLRISLTSSNRSFYRMR